MTSFGGHGSTRVIPSFILDITLMNDNVSRLTLCLFCRRTPTTVMVRESHVERMGSIQDVPYEILNVLEFNRCGLFLNLKCKSSGMLSLFDCLHSTVL